MGGEGRMKGKGEREKGRKREGKREYWRKWEGENVLK